MGVHLSSDGSHTVNPRSRLGTRRFPTPLKFERYLKTARRLKTGMAGSKVFLMDNGLGKRVGPVLVNG
jgi:hypothetical protein